MRVKPPRHRFILRFLLARNILAPIRLNCREAVRRYAFRVYQKCLNFALDWDKNLLRFAECRLQCGAVQAGTACIRGKTKVVLPLFDVH